MFVKLGIRYCKDAPTHTIEREPFTDNISGIFNKGHVLKDDHTPLKEYKQIFKCYRVVCMHDGQLKSLL
jgi:hypothetical protein